MSTYTYIYLFLISFSFFLMIPPPPISTLFPYTTLFRSVPASQRPAHHPDEVGGRGDGDRPHFPGVVPEGAARPRDRRRRPQPAHARPRDPREGARRAGAGAHLVCRRCLRERLHARGGAAPHQDRSVVPRPDQGDRRAGDGAR